MRILSKRIEVSQVTGNRSGKSVGFVPTMGALHQGHISLVKASRERCDITVVSIFVNPVQFNNAADLEKYPRTPEKDIDLLMTVMGEDDILFMPDENEIYNNEVVPSVNLRGLDTVMEGRFRPGHFEGVVRVVKILFDIVQPDMAFFGQKDFQQVAVVKEMARQIHPGVLIERCPILREADGLAMSSRNIRLTEETRMRASVIYNTLKEFSVLKPGDTIESVTRSVISRIDSTPGFKTEYFEIVDDVELKSLVSIEDANPARSYFGCIALFAGEVRLIDNMQFSFPV